ncbi:MAG: class I SAM-dependent methyltransferase [Pedobacter sp.]|nr:MAG: class I SAM-dependent methyltransferase [Pedobacter sp.]
MGAGETFVTLHCASWYSDRVQVVEVETKIGQEISSGNLDKFAPASFDIITLWHVLEHIHDLNGVMTKLSTLLKPEGKLIIAVPNSDSFDAQMYKEYWAAYDVPRHLYHFNQATMKRLLKKHKFELIECAPMKFDSYYVSMLSEKYKQGKQNLAKSVINGLKSNLHAMRNCNDYSSVIYISQHR